MDVQIVKCDFNIPEHCEAEIDLMKAYMTDEMGGKPPLTDEQNKKLIEGLKNHPTAFVLLAKIEHKYIGMTNSFLNFSTFAVKKFMNIHDVIVLKEYRGLGIGKKLIEANIEWARKLDCSKLTLEVRKDNIPAQKVYSGLGFGDNNPPMYFWERYL